MEKKETVVSLKILKSRDDEVKAKNIKAKTVKVEPVKVKPVKREEIEVNFEKRTKHELIYDINAFFNKENESIKAINNKNKSIKNN